MKKVNKKIRKQKLKEMKDKHTLLRQRMDDKIQELKRSIVYSKFRLKVSGDLLVLNVITFIFTILSLILNLFVSGNRFFFFGLLFLSIQIIATIRSTLK